MQCPNCGKEALNVNGKYVCLDCGIEVTSPADAQVTPAEAPQVSHTFGASDAASDTDDDSASINTPTTTPIPTPITSDTSFLSQDSAASDIDIISAAQAASVSGSQDSGQAEPQIPAASQGPVDQTAGAVQDSQSQTSPILPESVPGDVKNEGGVKDYYLEALKESAGEESGSYDFDEKQPEVNAAASGAATLQPGTVQGGNQGIQKGIVPKTEDVNLGAPPAQDIAPSNLGMQTDIDLNKPEDTSAAPIQPQEPKIESSDNLENQSAKPQENLQGDTTKIPEETANIEPELKEAVVAQTEEPPPQLDATQLSESTNRGFGGGDYFQPSAVDIAPGVQDQTQKTPQDQVGPDQPQQTQATSQDGFDGYSTPAGIGAGEPLVEDLANQNQPVSENRPLDQNIEPEEQGAAAPPQTPGAYDVSASAPAPETSQPAPDLDELLGRYANQAQPAQPAPAEPQAQAAPMPQSGQLPPQPYPASTPSVDTVMPSNIPTQSQYQISPAPPQIAPQIPGVGSIPTPESVFGTGEPPTEYEEPLVAEPPKKKRRSGLFIVIGLLVLLLIGGMAWLGLVLSGSRSKNTEQPSAQDLMFSLSEKVSKAMDASQGMVVTFDQSLDFSKATPKTPESGDTSGTEVLKLLFAGPVTAKGVWQTDKDSNLAVDAKFTNITEKKLYIVADKATYVQGAEGSWSKSDGMQITQIPPLYSTQNKGGLFYLTKVNALTEQGSETIDGKLYKKIKIDPKPDFVESILSGSNTALAETKYDNAEVGNLEILAWIDDDGKIFRVTAKGEIEITSDLYVGTVSVKSEVKYEYKDTQIKKPEGV